MKCYQFDFRYRTYLKNSYFLALLSSSNVNVASVEADKHAAEETERGELYSHYIFHISQWKFLHLKLNA